MLYAYHMIPCHFLFLFLLKLDRVDPMENPRETHGKITLAPAAVWFELFLVLEIVEEGGRREVGERGAVVGVV